MKKNKSKAQRAKMVRITFIVILVMALIMKNYSRSISTKVEADKLNQDEYSTEETLSAFNFSNFDTKDVFYKYNDSKNGVSSVVGVDVSEHQGDLDWSVIRNAGAEFAFIRAGYRGYGSGAINEDNYFQTNLKEAKEAGLKCGVYFYSQAITEEEAREEANFVLKQLGKAKLDYPIAYDFEIPNDVDARTWEIEHETISSAAVAFCDVIKKAGYTPMLYANSSTYDTFRNESKLSDVDIWYSQYTEGETYAGSYSIWQYSEEGILSGIGPIDLNIAFLNSKGKLISRKELDKLL